MILSCGKGRFLNFDVLKREVLSNLGWYIEAPSIH